MFDMFLSFIQPGYRIDPYQFQYKISLLILSWGSLFTKSANLKYFTTNHISIQLPSLRDRHWGRQRFKCEKVCQNVVKDEHYPIIIR